MPSTLLRKLCSFYASVIKQSNETTTVPLGNQPGIEALFPAILFVFMFGLAVSGNASRSPLLITMVASSPYYQPLKATVQSNRSIQWMNPTASPHTIRHDGCLTKESCAFDSGAVPPNGSYAISGLPPGQYPYHCELHPIMRGELIVQGELFPRPDPEDEPLQGTSSL